MQGQTEKQKEAFEKIKDFRSKIKDLLETKAFTQGFITATKFMVEVMTSGKTE